MAGIHKSLGRGLTALIPETAEEEVVVKVAVERLRPNPHQPRLGMNEKGLQELADSIRQQGVIQPLVVRPLEDDYQIISGARRLRAAIMAGLDQVPVIVREASDRELLELALVENLQREDLNPIEEARAYQQLLSEFGSTQEALAQRLGKERSTLANRLRLLKLPSFIQQDVAQGSLSEGHARALLSLEDLEGQKALRDEIISRGLTVRQAEKRARQLARPARRRRPKEEVSYAFLEEELRRRFATRVRILWTGKKGKIELEFYSSQDLDRILELLHS